MNDPKPRRTGAWVRGQSPIYRDGWYQVWHYTARPDRYEPEDMHELPPHMTDDDTDETHPRGAAPSVRAVREYLGLPPETEE